MNATSVLLILHILLLVAWLGIDVGVFSSSFVMRRPHLSVETRMTVRRFMRALDLAPRVSLILMIPVAVSLAQTTGFGLTGTPDWVLWVVGLGALAWAVVSVVSYRQTGPTGTAPTWVARFARLDWLMRAVAALFFAVSGLWSLVGTDSGPWNEAWVAWKSLLFGIIIALGLWIRWAAGKYRPALVELLEKGEGQGRLDRLNRDIRGVYPPVLMVWSLLIVIVVLAVARP